MKNTLVYWLHTLSPTHVGTGRGLGYIDLPIHRDCLTNWPAIPATAFKGVWADSFSATDEKRKTDNSLRAAFGVATDGDNESRAGALIPTDARLVCLPVRSFRGTFAWCTSHLALEFLRRDLDMAGFTGLPEGIPPLAAGVALHSPECVLKHSSGAAGAAKIFLADLDFEAKASEPAGKWAAFIAGHVFTEDTWKKAFTQRFAIIPDDAFNFLCETATEIAARVRIDDKTGTVADGALWNEELLPPESIFSGLISCDRVYGTAEGQTPVKLVKQFATDPLELQIGGKASTGRGQVRCVFSQPQGVRHDADK